MNQNFPNTPKKNNPNDGGLSESSAPHACLPSTQEHNNPSPDTTMASDVSAGRSRKFLVFTGIVLWKFLVFTGIVLAVTTSIVICLVAVSLVIAGGGEVLERIGCKVRSLISPQSLSDVDWKNLARDLGIQDADRLPPESLKGEIVKKLSQLFPSIRAETTPPTLPSGAEPQKTTSEEQIETQIKNLLQEFEKELGTRSPGTLVQLVRSNTLRSKLGELFPEGRFDPFGLVSDGELRAFWKDLTPEPVRAFEHVRALIQGLRRSFPDHQGSWLVSKDEQDFLGMQYERYYKALEVIKNIEDSLQEKKRLLPEGVVPGTSLLSEEPIARAFFLDRDAEVLRVLKSRLPELVAALEGDSGGVESPKSARECLEVFTDTRHMEDLDREIKYLEGDTDPKAKQFAEKLKALKKLAGEWQKIISGG